MHKKWEFVCDTTGSKLAGKMGEYFKEKYVEKFLFIANNNINTTLLREWNKIPYNRKNV